MSVLNRNMKISAKFKKNGYFGSFEWSGENYQKAYLMEIPTHVNGIVGDTIVTTGFSTTFPGGVLLRFVKNIKNRAEEFLRYNFGKYRTDFKKLNYVYVVTNYKKGEQLKLESLVK